MIKSKQVVEKESAVKMNQDKELGVCLAPRELTDKEVTTMWAKYPGLCFEDFFKNE